MQKRHCEKKRRTESFDVDSKIRKFSGSGTQSAGYAMTIHFSDSHLFLIGVILPPAFASKLAGVIARMFVRFRQRAGIDSTTTCCAVQRPCVKRQFGKFEPFQSDIVEGRKDR